MEFFIFSSGEELIRRPPEKMTRLSLPLSGNISATAGQRVTDEPVKRSARTKPILITHNIYHEFSERKLLYFNDI